MKRTPQKWAFRNSFLLLLSLIALYVVSDTALVHGFLNKIGEFGYIGAAVAGLFFVSIFTVAPAAIVLFHLAQELNPVLIALYAGAGGVVGDLIIFRFLKDRVFEELKPLFRGWGFSKISLFKSRYFAWISPVVGALIIASPLPDELGVGLLGLARIKPWQFVCLTFVLNTFGILAIVLLGNAL